MADRQRYRDVVTRALDGVTFQSQHSKILAIANLQDGAYFGLYNLNRDDGSYGDKPTFSFGVPGRWAALDDDLNELASWESPDWDVRNRPWARPTESCWIQYHDPVTLDLVESFVVPIPEKNALIIAGSFLLSR